MSRVAPDLLKWLARTPAERRLGPFELLEPIGDGGSAPVWLARETHAGMELRYAAIKMFFLGSRSDTQRERIVREAQALCSVDHPHVVRFYSLMTDDSRGLAGLAMEFVPGPTLGFRLAAKGPLDPGEALQVALAMLSALEAVHRVGLVHRDVKPDNIAETNGTWKLLDFGIAMPDEPSEEEGDNDLDPEATVRPKRGHAGTLGYMDPHCLGGAAASPMSDLYSLGATLYTCLSGHPPAMTNDSSRRLDPGILEGRRSPPPLDRAHHRAFDTFYSLVEQMVAAHPHERPPSLHWIKSRFEAIAQGTSCKTTSVPHEDQGPFRGLGRFESTDRGVFFGRDAEIAAALQLLRQHQRLALIGPSGSGKSSLARAGILPRVLEHALGPFPPQWDVVIMEPGRDPRAACVVALADHLDLPDEPSPEDVVNLLESRIERDGRGLCLLVDQLEDLVTLREEHVGDSRQWLVTLLGRLADAPSEGICVVVTARRDQLDGLLALPELGSSLARALLLVEPLRREPLREALLAAVSAYGYSFEDETMIDDMLAHVDPSEGSMSLVAFALTELWHERDPATKRLTRAGLTALGGLQGALERHAEATLAHVVRNDPRKIEQARRFLLAFTSPTGTRVIRTYDELFEIANEEVKPWIDVFVAARLCLPMGNGFTLAHESLVRHWRRLAEWFAAVAQDRQLADEIERAARIWRETPDTAPLLSSERLTTAHKLRIRDKLWAPSADVRTYLRASSVAIWKRRVLTGAIVALLLATIGATVVSYLNVLRAENHAAQLMMAQERERVAFAEKERRAADERRQQAESMTARVQELWEKLGQTRTPQERAERGRELSDALKFAKRASASAAPNPSAAPAPSFAPASNGLDKPRETPDDGLIREY